MKKNVYAHFFYRTHAPKNNRDNFATSCRCHVVLSIKGGFFPGKMASDTIIREIVADFLGGKKPFVEKEKMKLALSLMILLLPALSWAGWPVSGNKVLFNAKHIFLQELNATFKLFLLLCL